MQLHEQADDESSGAVTKLRSCTPAAVFEVGPCACPQHAERDLDEPWPLPQSQGQLVHSGSLTAGASP